MTVSSPLLYIQGYLHSQILILIINCRSLVPNPINQCFKLAISLMPSLGNKAGHLLGRGRKKDVGSECNKHCVTTVQATELHEYKITPCDPHLTLAYMTHNV